MNTSAPIIRRKVASTSVLGDTQRHQLVKFAGASSSGAGHKSGKTRFGLSAPQPAMINFDRSEDWLLQELALDILRDRIVMPPGDITLQSAQAALRQFEQDVSQAKALAKGGACETIFIDGGSLLTDIITIVKLDESTNPNTTFRYGVRNAYIKNTFNELNESGLNVIWTSKAKPLWVSNQRIAGQYVPDCHDDVPYMVDVNVQFVAEPSPEGQLFRGVIGTNGFNPKLVGKGISNLTWDLLVGLLGLGKPEEATA
jgi:hypothetical protein